MVCFLLIDAIQIDHPWKHSLLSISFNTVYGCSRVLASLSRYVNQLYGACANELACGAVARLEEGKVNPGRGIWLGSWEKKASLCGHLHLGLRALKLTEHTVL